MVRDLLAEAESRAGHARIARLNLRIGALAAVAPGALRDGAAALADSRWGHIPAIEITLATDPTAADAQGVRLVSIQVED